MLCFSVRLGRSEDERKQRAVTTQALSTSLEQKNDTPNMREHSSYAFIKYIVSKQHNSAIVFKGTWLRSQKTKRQDKKRKQYSTVMNCHIRVDRLGLIFT